MFDAGSIEWVDCQSNNEITANLDLHLSTPTPNETVAYQKLVFKYFWFSLLN